MSDAPESLLADLANTLVLGALLDSLRARDYELLAHWKQGEFHHDVVLACRDRSRRFATW